MSTPVRLLVGLGTLGGVGGGAYLLHQQLSTENIEKKLIANGYEILSDSASEWTQILTNYKERITAGKKDLQFDDFDGTTPSNNTENTLKEKCKSALVLPSSDEAYKKAKKWCTTPKKLTNILEGEKYIILNTKDNDDTTDQGEWNEIIDKHNKKTENTGKRFDGLASSNGGTLKKDETSRKEIKAACQTLLNKFYYDKDFESDLEKAKLWCVSKNKKE